MIGKVMRGRGFGGLARYLETGRDANNPDRVAWTDARNLPTDDPHTASLLMRATAAQSVRTEKPVYHIAISFDPDDAVDRATMVQVADRLLGDLQLQDHQALIVAHGDTHQPHLHVMVNRVHPETFRAWRPTNDYARIERSLREQERELGLRSVPGRHYDLRGQERPDRSEGLAAAEASGRERGTASRDTREAVGSPRLPEKRDHGDLARAGANGRPDPVEAPQGRSPEPRPHERSAPAPDRTAVTRERDRAESGLDGRDASAADRARGMEAPRPDPAGADRGNTGQSSSGALDPRLDAVRRSINDLERRIELERARDTAGDDLDRARVHLVPLTAQRAQARQASQRFRTTLAEVYRDPVAARRTFHAQAQRIGGPAAATEMGRQPQRFGELRGTQIGPIRSADRAAALQSASKLEHSGNEHVRRVREASTNRPEYRQAKSRVTHLEGQIRRLDAELDRGHGRAQLEHRLARQVRELQPPQRRTLLRSLPIPHRKLLASATMIGREFAREQGHDR